MSAPPRKAWEPAAPKAGPFCEVCSNQAVVDRVDVGATGDYYVRRAYCAIHVPDDGHMYWPLDRTGVRR